MTDRSVGSARAPHAGLRRHRHPAVDLPPEPVPDGDRVWSNPWRAALRLSLAAVWTAALLPLQWVLFRLRLPGRKAVPRLYHRGACHLLGITVAVTGRPVTDRGVLYLANHLSYLDISVLGGILRGSFVAKAEVNDWPLFGLLARLQGTVFVRRDRRRARHDLEEVQRRLSQGDALILFPEGTSGDGTHVLPFKSTLLAAAAGAITADGHTVTIQPVSLALTHVDGIPAGRALKPYYAWFGDMTMVPHLVAMAGLGRMRVQVTFHPPTSLERAGDRKTLARTVRDTVAAGVTGAQREGLGAAHGAASIASDA